MNPSQPSPPPAQSQPVMRSVADHRDRVLAGIVPLAAQEVGLLDAVGLVLAADVVAPWPLPSFDNSSMDGYAVLAADLVAASPEVPVPLEVRGEVAAGGEAAAAVSPGGAVRIMTGAPMPAGADTVVPVEATDGGTERVLVRESVAPGACVRRTGEDIARGEVVMPAGATVGTSAVAVLSAVGCATVPVVRRVRVVVVSTGDELVEPGTPPAPGFISDSNGAMLVALARAAGADARRAPLVRDDPDALRAALRAAAADADVVVTSGGVSMGAYDTVKAVLGASGEVEFTRVAMHPGMPQGQGRLRDGDVPVVTLPGNPVSSFVSFELFVRPLIRRLMGRAVLVRPTEQAVCTEAFGSPAGKRQYARGVLSVDEQGVRRVRPVGAQGSHVMGGLAHANALIEVPEDVTRVGVGDMVAVLDLLRDQP